jgi:hypothetical protein
MAQAKWVLPRRCAMRESSARHCPSARLQTKVCMVGGLQCPPCRALADFATPGRSRSAPQRAEPTLRTRDGECRCLGDVRSGKGQTSHVVLALATTRCRQPQFRHSITGTADERSGCKPCPCRAVVCRWTEGLHPAQVCTPPRFASRPRFAPLTRFAGSLVCSVVRCTEPCLDPPEVRSARSRSNPAQAAPNLVCRRLSSGLPTALPTAFVYSFQRVGGTDFGQEHHPDTGSGAILASIGIVFPQQAAVHHIDPDGGAQALQAGFGVARPSPQASIQPRSPSRRTIVPS